MFVWCVWCGFVFDDGDDGDDDIDGDDDEGELVDGFDGGQTDDQKNRMMYWKPFMIADSIPVYVLLVHTDTL